MEEINLNNDPYASDIQEMVSQGFEDGNFAQDFNEAAVDLLAGAALAGAITVIAVSAAAKAMGKKSKSNINN